MRTALLTLLFAGLQALPAPAQSARPQHETAELQSAQHAATELGWHPGPPAELFDVLEVVDGDTLHIDRHGTRTKLRLLSVDTEEKLSGNPNASPTKPETLFGEQCAAWAREFFARESVADGRSRVGLLFPDGVERFDVYGRLLCHVILPDGRDFNLLLVREGKSPYFNKYGESELCPDAFRRAQEQARAEQLGIWDPATNRPRDQGAPAARRPYDRLVPWWQARADAVGRFRALRAENPIRHVLADDPEALELAAFACEAGARVEVFGSVYKLFVEDDGDRTLLFRTGAKDRAFRARIDATHLDRFDVDDVRRRAEEEFCQNYLTVSGVLERRGSSFAIRLEEPEQLRVAGPEPVFAEPVPASSAGTGS